MIENRRTFGGFLELSVQLWYVIMYRLKMGCKTGLEHEQFKSSDCR